MQYRAQTDTPRNGLPVCYQVKRGRADRIAVELAPSRLNVARTLSHGPVRFNKTWYGGMLTFFVHYLIPRNTRTSFASPGWRFL
jgi:hypothetical protein